MRDGVPCHVLPVVESMDMVASPIFVFDSIPLVASCQFSIDSMSVAALAIAGARVQIPPAVYDEVITRGGVRPDALEAARLVREGQIFLADTASIGEELEDIHYYRLGRGEREALTLTAHVAPDAVLVTDDFLALVVAHRLGLPVIVFLDFIVGRVQRGELGVAEAQRMVQVVSTRYPQGFVPHSLALLGRLRS
jgi:predicted nucleic acid-binding protein